MSQRAPKQIAKKCAKNCFTTVEDFTYPRTTRLALISDYRNRLIICFFVIFVMAVMATTLTIRTLINSPDDVNRQSASVINEKLSELEPPVVRMIPNADLHSPPNADPTSSDMILISSWQQLYDLNDTSAAVRIKSLDSRSFTVEHRGSKFKNVRTLIVDGRITEKELTSVLALFSALSELVLNMNELCIASEHVNPVASAGILDLTSLEVLRLVDCSECPIVDWILASKVKRLHRFELCDSIVNKNMHYLISRFVHQRGDYEVKLRLLQGNEFCDECLFRVDELDEETLQPETENGERCFSVA